MDYRKPADTPFSDNEFSGNRYFSYGATAAFRYGGDVPGAAKTWSEWRALSGFDSDSQFSNAKPSGATVFVSPNRYEAGRANIIVYNWDNDESVNVDLSDLLSVGEQYRVMHVYDFFGTPFASGTYEGQPIQVPMRAIKAPRLIGTGHGECVGDGKCIREAITLPKEFAAFVLLSDS